MGENILIRGVNWVGDAVMTMPAIKAIRRAYPDASLSLLVKPWVSPLFEKSPDIDDIILYDENHKGIAGKLALAGLLKEKNFQKAILLQNAFDAALIAFLSCIPERIGYSRDLRAPLLTKAVPYRGEDRKMHHIEYFLKLLREAGIESPYSVPWIELSLEERLAARETLSALKRPVVGINPGAQFGPAKQWLPERFAALIDRIVGELDGSAVVFGGPAETELAQSIISGTSVPSDRVVSMAGKTSLRELIGLISECDAQVTTDSGPMHIGYATRTPLVAIFGSTEPSLTGPVGYGNRVIRHTLLCTPCFDRECKERDAKNMACMTEVTVDEVFEALIKVLPSKKAAFFDRDGTLCEYKDYLSNWNDIKVLHDINSLITLINKDYKLIGATNQSGVARGLVEEDFVKQVNTLFMEKYGFTDFYYCPHHPDERCSCRKPEPEMLLRARGERGIDLKKSFVVGDRESDMLLARAVGAKAVLVESDRSDSTVQADFRARSLTQAVDWILSQNN